MQKLNPVPKMGVEMRTPTIPAISLPVASSGFPMVGSCTRADNSHQAVMRRALVHDSSPGVSGNISCSFMYCSMNYTSADKRGTSRTGVSRNAPTQECTHSAGKSELLHT